MQASESVSKAHTAGLVPLKQQKEAPLQEPARHSSNMHTQRDSGPMWQHTCECMCCPQHNQSTALMSLCRRSTLLVKCMQGLQVIQHLSMPAIMQHSGARNSSMVAVSRAQDPCTAHVYCT
jgi:hypothetical protein